MELFSKRYAGGLRRAPRFRSNTPEEIQKFISDTLRNRLLHEIKYIIQSNEYLEEFLVVTDKIENSVYLHRETLRTLSLRELGYDLCQVINCETLEIDPDLFGDAKFFDLIELILIFCKEDKREEFQERINIIFKEEDPTFAIHSCMIIDRNEMGLRSLAPLVKDEILKNKLSEFYEINRLRPNYKSLASISADILQFLFSSPEGQGKTAEYSEKLCEEIAKKSTTKDQVNEFKVLLSETVKNAKRLSNKIANIRHSDKSTIPVDRPNFYKLIATENISLVELTILSLPERFILAENPSAIKLRYLAKYKLEAKSGWIREPKNAYSGEIKAEDLPF